MQGCFQNYVLVWNLLTHQFYCTQKWNSYRVKWLSRIYNLREEILIQSIKYIQKLELTDLLSNETWALKLHFWLIYSKSWTLLTRICNGRITTFWRVLTKFSTFKEKLTLWGDRIKRKNKVEKFELTEYYRLEKNFVSLFLQSLLRRGKNIDKYLPSLDVSFLD